MVIRRCQDTGPTCTCPCTASTRPCRCALDCLSVGLSPCETTLAHNWRTHDLSTYKHTSTHAHPVNTPHILFNTQTHSMTCQHTNQCTSALMHLFCLKLLFHHQCLAVVCSKDNFCLSPFMIMPNYCISEWIFKDIGAIEMLQLLLCKPA